MENAINSLPNEVLFQIFRFFSFPFLCNQLCIVSYRFAHVSRLIIFPAKESDEAKKVWKKAIFQEGNFWISAASGVRILRPIPEIAPPSDWILGIRKFYFNWVKYRDERQKMKNFFQFLADSNQIRDCIIELQECTDLDKFNLDTGYFAPMLGKVVEFSVKEFQVDDSYFKTGDGSPFTQPFMLEIPQLRFNIDRLVRLEHENSFNVDRCQRLDVANWLGTPLPSDSSYKAKKLFVSSSVVENVTGLVGLITLNFLHSSQPCPFDVFIDPQGNARDFERFLPSQPSIHPVTGEALQIRRIIYKYGKNQEQFLIRRCPAAQIADEPMFWSTKNCVEIEFDLSS